MTEDKLILSLCNEKDLETDGSNEELILEIQRNLGAKFWLVLSSDLDCEALAMIGWNPTECLFEDVGIFYTKP